MMLESPHPPGPDRPAIGLADASLEHWHRLELLARYRVSVPLNRDCGHETVQPERGGYVFFPAALDDWGWC